MSDPVVRWWLGEGLEAGGERCSHCFGLYAYEVEIAEKLVGALEGELALAEYEPDYRERVLELIRTKAEGEKIEMPPPEEREEEEGSLAEVLDLSDRTKRELYERAEELDIEGRSSMTKDELVEAIEKAEG